MDNPPIFSPSDPYEHNIWGISQESCFLYFVFNLHSSHWFEVGRAHVEKGDVSFGAFKIQ